MKKIKGKKETKTEVIRKVREAQPLTSNCLTFGRPDITLSKCQECRRIEECLTKEKEVSGTKKASSAKEKDLFGLIVGSKKSIFLHSIALYPCSMKDIQFLKWNDTQSTFYDCFNKESRKSAPKFRKDNSGRMFLVRSNLSDSETFKLANTIEQYQNDGLIPEVS